MSFLSEYPTIMASAALTLLLGSYLLRDEKGPYPPRPEPRFIIGNMMDIPLHGASRYYLELSKKLKSSLIYFNTFGYKMIVITDRKDAEELLEGRAKIYSDRTVVPTMEMIGYGYNCAFYPYNDKWRSHRRVCQQKFNPSAAAKFQPTQVLKVNDLLVGLLEQPEKLDQHMKMLSIAIPLSTMYGYTPTSLTDPVILAADGSIELGTQVISPGGSFANIFPLLKHVPWTWTQNMAKEIRRLTDEMKRIPLEALIKDMAAGKAEPCMVGDFLEKKQTSGATEDEEETILNVANTVYGAASDTTMSATESFFYLLAAHPEVQRKAQEELDSVLLENGLPRLPTLEDRSSLPYIEAIYREVLRWCPPLPMGLPHAASQDDWYNGYLIPKGTIISANVWAMTHDETRYPDPMAFKPERFFNDDGTLNDDDRILAYGFGRRVCVGKHMASSTMWLTIACVLACFNLEPTKGKDGNFVQFDDEVFEEGLLTHKTPFKCTITPRAEEWRSFVSGLKCEPLHASYLPIPAT